MPRKNGAFTIGLAGILAGIKGIEAIERLAKDASFRADRVLVFGLNFAEPGLLDRLRKLPNVEVTTDLTDFGFQEKLKNLDVLVNFRTKYQGEASYATLEAMRYGVPVVVRGDFGWYSELPDNAVIKVSTEAEIIPAVSKLKDDKEQLNVIGENARTTTKERFNSIKYVEVIERLMKDMGV
jgi:glycosyltransferase involved in cell wall biosynthesis